MPATPLQACLVLTAPGDPLPQRLAQGLAARELAVAWVADPAQVMLRLAQRPYAAVVVAEPQRASDRLGELVEALAAYHPDVLRWGYQEHGTKNDQGGDGGDQPWLGPLANVPGRGAGGDEQAAQAGGEAKSSEPVDAEDVEMTSPFHVESASQGGKCGDEGSGGEGGGVSPGPQDASQSEAAPDRWVTPEELAMLLGDAETG